MATNDKPVILIIHGGYFYADIWDDFRARLAKAGFESACPQLPSCGDKKPAAEKSGQKDDIEAVQNALRDLKAKGHRRIIAIAHSYGGVVACGALTDEFHGGESSVEHIIFLSAWIPQLGNTLEDVIKKYGFQCDVELDFNPEEKTAKGKNTAESFFGDIHKVDPARAAELAARTTTHNWAANELAVQNDPYARIASTFVCCTQDRAIKMPLQKDMVNDVVQRGLKMKTLEIESAHCPFLSKPDELVKIIEDIANSL